MDLITKEIRDQVAVKLMKKKDSTYDYHKVNMPKEEIDKKVQPLLAEEENWLSDFDSNKEEEYGQSLSHGRSNFFQSY
ncbi:hypothetical protein QVD17_16194 [Tagetes erecta]|uniref:Uncharacterized protein n=1 Tax=Tagetes erecta TaxID=13708 RepID=A0AAD8KTT3_TARER|nr:hypothetical protein QVD17_16194 [Tagetes erecta]